jgi:hypothetical protein
MRQQRGAFNRAKTSPLSQRLQSRRCFSFRGWLGLRTGGSGGFGLQQLRRGISRFHWGWFFGFRFNTAACRFSCGGAAAPGCAAIEDHDRGVDFDCVASLKRIS